jgi:hypothetical protein
VFGVLVKTGAAEAGADGTDVVGVEVVGVVLLPPQAVSRKTISEADRTRYRSKMYSPGRSTLLPNAGIRGTVSLVRSAVNRIFESSGFHITNLMDEWNLYFSIVWDVVKPIHSRGGAAEFQEEC